MSPCPTKGSHPATYREFKESMNLDGKKGHLSFH